MRVILLLKRLCVACSETIVDNKAMCNSLVTHSSSLLSVMGLGLLFSSQWNTQMMFSHSLRSFADLGYSPSS